VFGSGRPEPYARSTATSLLAQSSIDRVRGSARAESLVQGEARPRAPSSRVRPTSLRSINASRDGGLLDSPGSRARDAGSRSFDDRLGLGDAAVSSRLGLGGDARRRPRRGVGGDAGRRRWLSGARMGFDASLPCRRLARLLDHVRPQRRRRRQGIGATCPDAPRGERGQGRRASHEHVPRRHWWRRGHLAVLRDVRTRLAAPVQAPAARVPFRAGPAARNVVLRVGARPPLGRRVRRGSRRPRPRGRGSRARRRRRRRTGEARDHPRDRRRRRRVSRAAHESGRRRRRRGAGVGRPYIS